MAKRQNKGSQSRWCFLETYVSPARLLEVLEQRQNQIRRFAWIIHDKDVWRGDESHVEGSPKQAHIHLLLQFRNPVYESQVRDYFFDYERHQNTLSQEVRSPRACYLYLTHEQNPEKHQYSKLEIHSNDMDYFEKLSADEEFGSSTVEATLAIADGKRSTRDLLMEYGRDFVIHSKQILEVGNQIRREDGVISEYESLTLTCDRLRANVRSLQDMKIALQAEVQSLFALRNSMILGTLDDVDIVKIYGESPLYQDPSPEELSHVYFEM